MTFNELLPLIKHSRITSQVLNFDFEVKKLAFDSREVIPHSIFFAIPGTVDNGVKYISNAINRGAGALVLPQNVELSEPLGDSINYIQVANVREILSEMADIWFTSPSSKISMFGITGTNGKTSTAWMLSQLLGALSTTLYMGTIGEYSIESHTFEKIREQHRTTLDPLSLHSYLSDSLDRDTSFAVIEATSHGLEQYRTSSINWDVAGFTNLTQDHLDHHPSMEAYAAAKYLLFSRELKASKKINKAAVINVDDPYGAKFAEAILSDVPDIELIRVSEKNPDSELYLSNATLKGTSTKLKIEYKGTSYVLETKLIGSFNITNLLLAIGMVLGKGISLDIVKEKVVKIAPAPGRLQLVSEARPRVFVDYAHTPDALNKVLKVAKDILLEEASQNDYPRGRLITVFGCGGDRDKSKRRLMGIEVAMQSDIAVVTSDNPRTEDPLKILEDIIPGIVEGKQNNDVEYRSFVDRKEAIFYAISNANKSDIVLIAGKGHEDYQDIEGRKIPFDDAIIARECLQKILKKVA